MNYDFSLAADAVAKSRQMRMVGGVGIAEGHQVEEYFGSSESDTGTNL